MRLLVLVDIPVSMAASDFVNLISHDLQPSSTLQILKADPILHSYALRLQFPTASFLATALELADKYDFHVYRLPSRFRHLCPATFSTEEARRSLASDPNAECLTLMVQATLPASPLPASTGQDAQTHHSSLSATTDIDLPGSSDTDSDTPLATLRLRPSQLHPQDQYAGYADRRRLPLHPERETRPESPQLDMPTPSFVSTSSTPLHRTRRQAAIKGRHTILQATRFLAPDQLMEEISDSEDDFRPPGCSRKRIRQRSPDSGSASQPPSINPTTARPTPSTPHSPRDRPSPLDPPANVADEVISTLSSPTTTRPPSQPRKRRNYQSTLANLAVATEILAPQPLDLIQRGCQTQGAPYHRSVISQGAAMSLFRKKFNNDRSPTPHAATDIKLFPQDLACNDVDDWATRTLALAIQYAHGSSPFAPNATYFSRYRQPTQAQLDWLQTHRKEILGTRGQTSKLQPLADAFSTHFGVQASHAIDFWSRYVGEQCFLARDGNTKSPPLTPQERRLLYSSFLLILDKARNPTLDVDPDLHWTLRDLRTAEWSYLLGMVMSESTDKLQKIQTITNLCRSAIDNVNLSQQQRDIFEQTWNRPYHQDNARERAASGVRIRGDGFPNDLDRMDAFPEPISTRPDPPYYDSDDWTELLTLLYPPYRWDHTSNPPTSSPRLLRILLRSGLKTDGRHCLAFRGTRLNNTGDDILDPNFDFPAAMTPPFSSPGRNFQGIALLSIKYRDLSDGLTEIAFLFADPAHRYVAATTQQHWRAGILLQDLETITTSDIDTRHHPLSVLQTTIDTENRKCPRWFQTSLGSAMLPEPAQAVMIIAQDDTKVQLRVSYSSPLAATKMIGRKVPWKAYRGDSFPFHHPELTHPLTPHHAAYYPTSCINCGTIGHSGDNCPDTIRSEPFRGCLSCRVSNDPQPCNNKPCKHVLDYYENSKAMVAAAIEDTRDTGIYSASATELRQQLYHHV